MVAIRAEAEKEKQATTPPGGSPLPFRSGAGAGSSGRRSRSNRAVRRPPSGRHGPRHFSATDRLRLATTALRSDGTLTCNLFFRRAVPWIAVVLCVPLLVFMLFGDAQWSRFSFVMQYYLYPRDTSLWYPPSQYTGTFTRWTSSGGLLHRAEMRDGVLDGYYFNRDETSWEEGFYRQGQRHGRLLQRTRSGKLEEVHFDNGLHHGTRTLWNADGVRILAETYVHGQRDGACHLWHANGPRRKTVVYCNGKHDGPVRMWSADGRLVLESHWVQGRKDGPVRRWYENGRPRLAGEFRAGRPVGEWSAWHFNGQRKSRVSFDANGFRTGAVLFWYANGQMRKRIPYRYDRSHGEYRIWHKNGQLAEAGRCEAGRIVGRRRTWDRDGTLLVDEVRSGDGPETTPLVLPDEDAASDELDSTGPDPEEADPDSPARPASTNLPPADDLSP